MPPPGGVRRRERSLATLATCQHGVVTRRQLRALGFGDRAIDERLASRRLTPLHRGVFSVGHGALGVAGVRLGAVLALGPTAVLSHRSAAALWEVRPTASTRVEVTVPGRARRRRDGLVIHLTRVLPEAHRTVRDGTPVTTVARTLVDLADVLATGGLRRAIERAERQELLDMAALHDVIERCQGRRGLRRLVPLLAGYEPAPPVRSELERLFLELCEAHELPRPLVNAVVAGYEVDASWPQARVAVELDGDAYHRTKADRRRDRARDLALSLAGYVVLRFDFWQVSGQGDAVAAAVRAALVERTPG